MSNRRPKSSGLRLRAALMLAMFLPVCTALPRQDVREPGVILVKRNPRVQQVNPPSHHGLFDMYDVDSDGYLSPMEVVLLLQRPDHTEAVDEFVRHLKALFTTSETNGDGKLDLAEFTRAFTVPTSSRDPTEVEAAGSFEIFDENGDRILNFTEVENAIRQMTGTTLSGGLIEKMFAHADVNGDGVIDQDEFTGSMKVLEPSAARI